MSTLLMEINVQQKKEQVSIIFFIWLSA